MADKARNDLDLVGTPCPMNFVRIVIALEELQPGEVVEARVDGGLLGLDLQRSLSGQVYEVLALEEQGTEAVIRVRKKSK